MCFGVPYHSEIRSTIYRLSAGSKRRAYLLNQTVNACVATWNFCVERHKKGLTTKSKDFTEFRHANKWIEDLGCEEVRSAYMKFKDSLNAMYKGARGDPKYKGFQYDGSFSIPQIKRIEISYNPYNKKIKDCKVKRKIDGTVFKIRLTKIGWVKISCGKRDIHAHGEPRTAVIRRTNTGKWYASISWRVLIPQKINNNAVIGIDKNTKKYGFYMSNGEVYYPHKYKGRIDNIDEIDREIKYLQTIMFGRKRVLKLDENGNKRFKKSGKIMTENSGRREKVRKRISALYERKVNMRKDWAHWFSKYLSKNFSNIGIEDLDIKGMTKSAKGTIENPGTGVKAKSNLNNQILSACWGEAKRQLEYKADNLIKVNPNNTSRKCSRCGNIDKNNRKVRSEFKCTKCGFNCNADFNAALNIKALAIEVFEREKAKSIDFARKRKDTFNRFVS